MPISIWRLGKFNLPYNKPRWKDKLDVPFLKKLSWLKNHLFKPSKKIWHPNLRQVFYRLSTNQTFSRSQTGLDWICSLDNHLWRAQKPWAVLAQTNIFDADFFSRKMTQHLSKNLVVCWASKNKLWGLISVSSRLNSAAVVYDKRWNKEELICMFQIKS